ncbi:peptidoglycan recognition protein 4-like [Ptychodera flava]|uniref:peptidoglycan recognition protein 4-like n=1 Tax=Ptychodera flava TaxID=63121 RepID=UPI00396A9613
MLRIFHFFFTLVLLSYSHGAFGAAVRGYMDSDDTVAVFSADTSDIGNDNTEDTVNIEKQSATLVKEDSGLKKRDVDGKCATTCPVPEERDPYSSFDYMVYGVKDWWLNLWNSHSRDIRNLFEKSRIDMEQALKLEGQLDKVSSEACTYALWMYRTAHSYGAETAKVFGDAHERTEEISRGERVKKLRNLCIGRCLVSQKTDNDGIDVIMRALVDGTLQTTDYERELYIFSREEWDAEPPKRNLTEIKKKVSKVVIHHTAGGECTTIETCKKKVKDVQLLHKYDKDFKWWDIGYNFLVGEDGNIYEGRGWDYVGSHATPQNGVSYGISVLGNFNERTPNNKALQAIRDLIELGIHKKYIPKDYILRGHKDIKNKDCPGHKFYEEIVQWPNYSNHRKFCDAITFNAKSQQVLTSLNPPVNTEVSTVIFMESGNQELSGTGTTGETIDISFTIDRRGTVYENLGWNVNLAGINAYVFNFIGNFVSSKPSDKSLRAAQDLIECGQEKGHIIPNDPILKAHDSIRNSANNLYDRIKDFPNFDST